MPLVPNLPNRLPKRVPSISLALALAARTTQKTIRTKVQLPSAVLTVGWVTRTTTWSGVNATGRHSSPYCLIHYQVTGCMHPPAPGGMLLYGNVVGAKTDSA